jgi:hypothetical protein
VTKSAYFKDLEAFQADWIAANGDTLPAVQRTSPADILHWWGRLWEVPFVLSTIERALPSLVGGPGSAVKILDVASSITFVPWWAAKSTQ